MSRQEYVKAQKRRNDRAFDSKIIVCFAGASIAALLGTVCMIVHIFTRYDPAGYGTWDIFLWGPIFIVCMGFGSYFSFRANRISVEIKHLDSTLEQLRDSMTSETLVRASQEPEQLQQSVLLRATQSNDTPPEELLRPTQAEKVPIKQYEQEPIEIVTVAARNE